MRLDLELLDIIDDRRNRIGAAKRALVIDSVQKEQVAAVGLAVY